VSRLKKFRDVLATYRRHGWRLVRVLATAETLGELRESSRAAAAHDDANKVTPRGESDEGEARVMMDKAASAESGAATFEGVAVAESEVDAMWFTRAAAGGREAWELRLVAEPPYALFELFEPDESEEDREDVRREMEARLREYAAPSDVEGEA
jgi:hypothetical protein